MLGPNAGYEMAQQWAIFLDQDKLDWSWYCHMTFRGDPHPETASKVFDKWIHILNREIFGVRYWKDKTKGVVTARATEYQDRGAIHYHCLIGRIPGHIKRLKYMDLWNELAGYARIYKYEKDKGAEYYMSKSSYAWKHGEIDLGGTLGSWQQLKLAL